MSFDRKAIKQQARMHVRKHYMLLAVLCAITIFLGTESNIVSNAQIWYDTLTQQVTELDLEGIRNSKIDGSKIINDLIEDSLAAGREETASRMREMQANTDPASALGRSRGIFAAVANNVSSGHLYAIMVSAVHSVVHSQQAVAVIMIILSAAFYALVWIFLRNIQVLHATYQCHIVLDFVKKTYLALSLLISVLLSLLLGC